VSLIGQVYFSNLFFKRVPNTIHLVTYSATLVHAYGKFNEYFLVHSRPAQIEPVLGHNLTPARSISYRELSYVDVF
jgi:hypothetical protein